MSGSQITTSTITADQITITSLSFDNISIGTPLGSTFIGKYLKININGAGPDSGIYKIPLYT